MTLGRPIPCLMETVQNDLAIVLARLTNLMLYRCRILLVTMSGLTKTLSLDRLNVRTNVSLLNLLITCGRTRRLVN